MSELRTKFWEELDKINPKKMPSVFFFGQFDIDKYREKVQVIEDCNIFLKEEFEVGTKYTTQDILMRLEEMLCDTPNNYKQLFTFDPGCHNDSPSFIYQNSKTFEESDHDVQVKLKIWFKEWVHSKEIR